MPVDFRVRRGWCPFGCKNADPELGSESQFDDHGYCTHVVGFLNLPQGSTAVGRMMEPLTFVPFPIRDEAGKPTFETRIQERQVALIDAAGKPLLDAEGKPKFTVQQVKVKVPLTVHSGLLRVDGRHRVPVLATDVVVTPRELQTHHTWTEMSANNGQPVEVTHKPKLGIVAWVFREGHEAPIVLKVQDDDPRAELQRRIEDKYAELGEMEEKAKRMDLERGGSDVDEEAEAEATTAAEHERMKEHALAGR